MKLARLNFDPPKSMASRGCVFLQTGFFKPPLKLVARIQNNLNDSTKLAQLNLIHQKHDGQGVWSVSLKYLYKKLKTSSIKSMVKITHSLT